ncbi:MAG TPA: class I SAM-dependent methyltransferase [Candidatus Omnitrophota bacterium]|nr:class I SAM-dependent methyltransferase [Candidatus Omnitrophota bacterium]
MTLLSLAAFYPAANFKPKVCPNLNRMTGAPSTGCVSREYWLTDAGARAIEQNPQALLHNRLYDLKENTVYLYSSGGRDICAITTETSVKLGSLDSPFIDRVRVASPEEIEDGVLPESVELHHRYPSIFLPYDLDRIKADVETELRNGQAGYRSRTFPHAIYFGSDPFFTYQVFHYLTTVTNPLSDRISGLKHVIDLGSGLGIISFALSQFISSGARMSGIEFDPLLVSWSYRIRQYLQNRLGHEVGPTRFYQGDIRAGHDNARIEEADAVIGWFPMNHAIKDEELASIFARLRPGGLVFQLNCSGPLVYEDIALRYGFRKLETEACLPVTIYEKLV